VRFLVFRTYVTACSCRDSHPPHPCGGWKDCSDGHALSICWNRACFHSFHRPSCPCPSWFVVDVVTPLGRHSLKHISIFSPLRCTPPLATAGRTPLRPGAQPVVNNQGQSACFAVHRTLHAVLLLVRRARLPTSEQSLSPSHTSLYIHTA
jgi:hypothetical protein